MGLAPPTPITTCCCSSGGSYTWAQEIVAFDLVRQPSSTDEIDHDEIRQPSPVMPLPAKITTGALGNDNIPILAYKYGCQIIKVRVEGQRSTSTTRWNQSEAPSARTTPLARLPTSKRRRTVAADGSYDTKDFVTDIRDPLTTGTSVSRADSLRRAVQSFIRGQPLIRAGTLTR